MTILLMILLALLLPWSWTKRCWCWFFSRVYSRSALKVGVEVAGKKVKSWKEPKKEEAK